VHDVVAHTLSMVSIPGAALRVFDRDPEQARQALQLIHRTNQQSLADLRRTLGMLRQSEHEDGEATPPTPGLGQLAALIETVRAGGLKAGLLVEGTPVPVAALVELPDDQYCTPATAPSRS
jgi:signal transduction histidine kinase